MKSEARDNGPWYKQRWPWILMAGPGVVIVAGVITVVLAITSNDGLVSDDYYKQGLTVNQRLQRDHHAADMGMQMDLMRAGLSVRVMVMTQSGAAMPPKLVLKLMHPTRAGQDQAVELVEEQPGFYGGKLAGDIAGRWHVSIEDPAGQWRLQGDWLADGAEPMHLVAGK